MRYRHWKFWATVFPIIGSLMALAQQPVAFTNSIGFTQAIVGGTAWVNSAPATTNDAWQIKIVLTTTNVPGWVPATNNVVVAWMNTAAAVVSISNSEIAAYSGLSLTQVLNTAYFSAATQAEAAAAQKLMDAVRGR